MNNNLYFILSASCKLVKGYTRSIIIDYSRGDLYFITHEYLELVEKIDRKKLGSASAELGDESSIVYFNEFVSFLIENEIGFLTEDAALFPKISDHVTEDYIQLQDVIIEIDAALFNKDNFIKVCRELGELKCADFQIRLLSEFDISMIESLIETVTAANANYIEIHCTYNEKITKEALHNLIQDYTLLSKIFLYSSPQAEIYPVINEIPDYHPIILGEAYFIDYSFDNGNCCGIINHENLNFTSFYLHNKLKKKNGCLDKKISIDKFGNIKNCPSMPVSYGSTTDISLRKVLEDKVFTGYWNISKDQISTCRICEFRYNCTDCRAFIENPDDIYSKPSKCSYNPLTGEWGNQIHANQ